MAGQDDVELVDGHWTYKQDGKGRVQKIEANLHRWHFFNDPAAPLCPQLIQFLG